MATSTLARPPPSTAATWWSKLGRPGHLATAGRQPVTASIVYLLSSLLLFGLPVLADPAHMYVGSHVDPDPKFFFWALSWWPHALAHGLNPLWTHAVWGPHGYNLAWATGAPGPSLLVSPLTLAAGPVVSYNLLALLACPLAAWSAFLLCRHVTGRFAPSLLGGYLFGFSTYMLGHVGIHVNLELVFPVPLAVYLVLRRLDGSISLPGGSRAGLLPRAPVPDRRRGARLPVMWHRRAPGQPVPVLRVRVRPPSPGAQWLGPLELRHPEVPDRPRRLALLSNNQP